MEIRKVWSSGIFQFVLWLFVVMGVLGPVLWYYVPYEYDVETIAKVTRRDSYLTRRRRNYRCTIEYADKTGKVYRKEGVTCGCCGNEMSIYYSSKDPNNYSTSTKVGRFVGFMILIFFAYLFIFAAVWIRLHPESAITMKW